MTTCPFCLDHMAARSARQLANRKANMADAPHITVAPCPTCGGIEWATTDGMVEPDRPSRLRRFWNWMLTE